MDSLKRNAENGRVLYNSGLISRNEAKEMIEPYIEEYNRKSIETAKKYGLKPKKITLSQYIR